MLLGKLRAQRLVLVIASQYVDLGYRPIQSSQEGRRPTKRSRTVRYPRIRRLPAFRPHKRAGTTADRLHYIHKDKKGQSAPVFAEPRQRRVRRSKTDDTISGYPLPKNSEIASLRSQRQKGSIRTCLRGTPPKAWEKVEDRRRDLGKSATQGCGDCFTTFAKTKGITPDRLLEWEWLNLATFTQGSKDG